MSDTHERKVWLEIQGEPVPSNLKSLQHQVYKWSTYNFPNNEPIDPMIGMVEEIGELAHALLKFKQKIREGYNPQMAKYELEDAVHDIIIYAADFCARNGINLGSVYGTWAEVRKRDWRSYPKTGFPEHKVLDIDLDEKKKNKSIKEG